MLQSVLIARAARNGDGEPRAIPALLEAIRLLEVRLVSNVTGRVTTPTVRVPIPISASPTQGDDRPPPPGHPAPVEIPPAEQSRSRQARNEQTELEPCRPVAELDDVHTRRR